MTVLAVTGATGQIGGRLARALPEEQTLEQAYVTRRVFTDEQWQLDAWVSTYTAIRGGAVERVSEDGPRLLGRAACTLEEALAA